MTKLKTKVVLEALQITAELKRRGWQGMMTSANHRRSKEQKR
jgi:hypothetical protein